MSKTKKEYLSEPINVELDWINDIRNRYIRSNMRKLDLSISITYTYFIYHDYTVAPLAKINETTERQVIIWILIAAYTLDGGEYRFGAGLIDTVLVLGVRELAEEVIERPHRLTQRARTLIGAKRVVVCRLFFDSRREAVVNCGFAIFDF